MAKQLLQWMDWKLMAVPMVSSSATLDLELLNSTTSIWTAKPLLVSTTPRISPETSLVL